MTLRGGGGSVMSHGGRGGRVIHMQGGRGRGGSAHGHKDKDNKRKRGIWESEVINLYINKRKICNRVNYWKKSELDLF